MQQGVLRFVIPIVASCCAKVLDYLLKDNDDHVTQLNARLPTLKATLHAI
ncbi:MAG: hypothetical protein IJY13_01125 [Clostridia bacterium]|nr:hypothetical protein [Clostridia bacterium]